MAWSFGDGFDLYAAIGDATGYWDVANGSYTFVAGRFAGSQAISIQTSSGTSEISKSSGVNDAVHHIVIAFRQTAAISGSTLGFYLQLRDGATAQCSIVFRSDGAILLASGAPTGTALATYTSAFPVTNTWYAYEFEVVINNTTGSFKVRRDGSPTDSFSATGLNTRVSANNYANKLLLETQGSVIAHQFDDLFWRSDASSVAWMGDIRCHTRMPASDASVTFSRLGGATNFSNVDEAQQNAATDYVYSSTAGQADFYAVASIASTPATVIATTTRAYAQKSDTGTRTAAVQLKSGATTTASSTLTLSLTGWLWAWRLDTTDPNTGAAWTPAGVNAATIGPKVIA
jgi:hypothetical protein